MKTSHPPVLASWLLKHLVSEGQNEILAGDLLEEFGERGSAWYWRQVLAAIVAGFFQVVRVRWTAILFVTVFSAAFALRYIWIATQFQSLLHRGIRLPWPLSLIFQIGFLILFNSIVLLLAVGVYLAVVRNSNSRKQTKALLVGLSVIAVTSAAWYCLLPVLRVRFIVSFPFLAYLPLFFGLLISTWIVAPGVARAESKRLPAENGSNA
jgi:hypothetical protein